VPEDSHSTTKDLVRQLVRDGLTVTEIAQRLRVSKPTVCFHMRTLGIRADSRFSRRYDWAEVREYYEAGYSMRACQKKFGFSGAAWSEAVRRGEIDARPRAEPLEAVFVSGAKRNRFHLKRRLLAEGLRDPCCEECGLEEWRGEPLSLELHHRNGDPTDNRLENLSLLCPNCHSQTDNWGGRGKASRAA
jgi:transposase